MSRLILRDRVVIAEDVRPGRMGGASETRAGVPKVVFKKWRLVWSMIFLPSSQMKFRQGNYFMGPAADRVFRFVLTGSNQPALGEAISQSLAGRTSIHHLLPLSLEELASGNLLDRRDEVLLKGFLPRLYDASLSPGDVYSSYFATYVERDVRRLINVRDIAKFETFIRLLAGRHDRRVTANVA